MSFNATRLPNNPIITEKSVSRETGFPNGPSLIRVPDWLPNPLGSYYLYYANHVGTYIRLAYADDLRGPWRIHEGGTLQLEQTGFINHIASPDVRVDSANRRIAMYFHGVNPPEDRPIVEQKLKPFEYWFGCPQSSRTAVSSDGVNFDVIADIEPPVYMRVFDHKGRYYCLSMPGFIFESKDGLNDWKAKGRLFRDEMRHCAVLTRGDRLHVFYTCRGDAPEVIYHAAIEMTGDASTWQVGPDTIILKPETEWEGATEPVEPSKGGGIRRRVNQLRDPAIFEDEGKVYLLYAGGGEECIGIAELTE